MAGGVGNTFRPSSVAILGNKDLLRNPQPAVRARSRHTTLGFLVRVQNTISGPREGTHLCSSPNSGINERFEDLRLDFELI